MVNRCRRGLFSRVLNVYILFRRSTLNRHVPGILPVCCREDLSHFTLLCYKNWDSAVQIDWDSVPFCLSWNNGVGVYVCCQL